MQTSAAQNVIAQLDAAVTRFGTYIVHDRLADEYLDLDKVKLALHTAGVEPATDTLLALANHEHGEGLRYALITDLVENDEWPELAEHLLASEHAATFVPWLLPNPGPDVNKNH